jgi:cell wall-associated NlpC family hydrolase
MSRSTITIFITSLLLVGLCKPGHTRDATDQLKPVVNSQTGLNKVEKRRLTRAIENNFKDVPGFRPRTFSSVQAVINAGLFEMSVNTGDEDGPISELDMARICNVAKATYTAMENGADPALSEDIALVGFAHEITAGQIEAAAKALEALMQTSISVGTYQELISQALDNLWMPEVTRKTSAGLVRGAGANLDPEMLTLTLIIGVAQDLEDKGIDTVVKEAETYVRTRKDAAYDALKQAMSQGLAPPIGREIYYIAMEERWSAEISRAVFEGLTSGQKMGLTPEKLAIALIIRVAQGLEDTPAPVAVREEIEFVKKLDKVEQKRIENIQNNPDLKKAYESTDQWAEIAYVPPTQEQVAEETEPEKVEPAPAAQPAEVTTAEAPESDKEKAPPIAASQPEPEKKETPAAAIETKPEKKASPPVAAAETKQDSKPAKKEAPAVTAQKPEEKASTPVAVSEPKPDKVKAPPVVAPQPEPEKKEVPAAVASKPTKETSPPVVAPEPNPEKKAPPVVAASTPKPEKKKAAVKAQKKVATPAPSKKKDLAATLEAVHRSLIQASINDYLGTPYKWGGTAKKSGTDCSGFTQGIYRDQGIKIPRVSRDQFKRLPLKLKAREELVWGDLIFFNKNGGSDNYITHVGMFMGKDPKNPKLERFVHSCCSKGVTVSRFNKRYYLSRYVGGVRVGSVSDTEG